MNQLMRAVVLVLLIIPGLVVAAPVLHFDATSGQLLGASKVQVLDAFYAVEFVDGSCVSLFSGCDEETDFTFTTGFDAVAASFALLDQVFVATPLFDLDVSVGIVSGCSVGFPQCEVWTPWRERPGFVDAFSAFNFESESLDMVYFVPEIPTGFDSANALNSVWGVWTFQSFAPVPEPATTILLLLGLAGLTVARSRKR